MSEDPVPKHLRDFVARYIDSVAQLEALLLLRANPAEGWSGDALAKRIYIDSKEALEILERLCRDGLATRTDDIFQYDGLSSEHAKLVDELADAYRRQLIPITRLIHGKPRQIRAFADAFKFTKER